MTKRLVSLFAFLFILAISEIEAVVTASELYENPSKTYSGKCNDIACNKKCLSWEGAVHGACNVREDKSGCFCYYNSYKDKSQAPKDKSSLPSKYGSPPPPKGGSPPPPAKGSPPPPAKGGSPSPPGSPPPPAKGGSPSPPGSPPPPAKGGSPSPPGSPSPSPSPPPKGGSPSTPPKYGSPPPPKYGS